MRNEISDAALEEHYARDYYGPGTNYFEPPDFEEDLLEDDLGVLDEEMEEMNETENYKTNHENECCKGH